MAKKHSAHNRVMPILQPHIDILKAKQDISALDMAVKMLSVSMKDAVESCYAFFTQDVTAKEIASLDVHSRKAFDICFGEWLLAQETTYEEGISSFVQIFFRMERTNISAAQKIYLQSLKSTVLSLYRVEETARENHIVIRQILSDTQKVLRVQYNPVLPNLYAGEIVGLRLLSTDEGHSSGYGVYRFPPDIQDKLCMSAEHVYAALPEANAAEKDEHIREAHSIIEEIIIRTWSAMTSSFNAKMRRSLQKKHS